MPGTDNPDPAAWLQSAEKRETLRQKALELLSKPKGPHPDGKAWAEHWAQMPPLVIPPQPGETHAHPVP